MWRRIYPSSSSARCFSGRGHDRWRWLFFSLAPSLGLSRGIRYLWQRFPFISALFLVFSYGVATIPDGWLERQLSGWWPYSSSRYQHSFFLSEWVERVALGRSERDEESREALGIRFVLNIKEKLSIGALPLYRNLDTVRKFGPFVGGEINTKTRHLLLKGDHEEITQILDSIPSLNLSRRNFKYANLVGTSLVNINLFRADLQGADLREADLQGAYLSRAHLQGSVLSGINWNYVDLKGVGWGTLLEEEREALLEVIALWVSDEQSAVIQQRLLNPLSGQLPPVDETWDCLSDNPRVSFCRHGPEERHRYVQLLANQLISLACGSSSVAQGIWKYRLEVDNLLMIPQAMTFFSTKAETRLQDSPCPGLAGLPDETKEAIRRASKRHLR